MTRIVNSGTAVGSGLGLISSSYFVGKGILPWQSLIWITVALIAIMVVVFIKFIKNDKVKPAEKVIEVKTKEAKNNDSLLKQLFRPQMVAAYVLYFSTLYTYYLIDTWLPNFLETERGFEGTAIGLVSSLVFFAAIPGALVFSRLADMIPHKKVPIIIGLELMAAAMLLFMIETTSQSFVIVGIILYGFFGKLAVEPIIISWLSQFASRKSIATTYGVFNFFGMTASVIVPSLTGKITDMTGSMIYAFYLAIGIILVGTIVFFLVNKFAPKIEEA